MMTPWSLCRHAVPSVASIATRKQTRALSSLSRIGGQTTPLHGEAYLTIASRRRGGRMVIAATLVDPLPK